jgi:Putative DNA-binding domain
MTFNLPIAQIDASLLETLKADAVQEGRQLEYKETLPGSSDNEKQEFLKDVSAFANSAGGDLIYGIRERRQAGQPTSEIGAIVGLPGLNFDPERLRLEAMIRDGVAPRIAPITFLEIPRGSDPPCLLLRVPRSFVGLHMITFKKYSRFYARTSAGTYQLDVHEIRAGFVAAETAFERLRHFRLERVARVLALETPAPMATGPKLILHAFPVNMLDEVWARILTMEEVKVAFAIAPINGEPSSWRFNLDGFVVHTQRTNLSRQCYTQLFRDGGIEAVSGSVIVKIDERGGFYPMGMEEKVINGLEMYKKFWQEVGLTPPLAISLTLSGVKGWKVLRSAYHYHDVDAVFDRDVVSPPEVMLSDLAIPADVMLRPLFDVVWNGGGWPASPNYQDGRWIRPSS